MTPELHSTPKMRGLLANVRKNCAERTLHLPQPPDKLCHREMGGTVAGGGEGGAYAHLSFRQPIPLLTEPRRAVTSN